MSTVYKRLSIICEQNSWPMPDMSVRNEIGKKVAEKWRESGIKKKAVKIRTDEPGCKKKVWHYHKIFHTEIDNQIMIFSKQ